MPQKGPLITNKNISVLIWVETSQVLRLKFKAMHWEGDNFNGYNYIFYIIKA